MSRAPGDLITKDPDSSEPQGFDWTAYLAELGSGVEIAGSEWFVSGPDSALDFENDTVLSGNLRTQCYLTGGTPNRRYKVTNRITTNAAPAVADDRSFYVRIVQK